MIRRSNTTKLSALGLVIAGSLLGLPAAGEEVPLDAATPEPTASPEDSTGEGTDPRMGDSESPAAPQGGGVRSVLELFRGGGGTPGSADSAQRASSEESQKRVNELGRLATASVERGRVGEAIRNINDMITLKPYDANFHFALGLCLRKEGKYRDALKKYQDVLDLGGPKALVAILRAEAYAADGLDDKVFDSLKEAAIGGRNIITDVHTLPLLARYQQNTEFIKLALHLEKFGVSAGRAHDPFTNPFPKPDVSAPGRTDVAEGPQALTPEEQEKLLLDARKTYERVKFYIKLEDETKAMKAYSSLRDMIKRKDQLQIPKIVNEFRFLVAQLEALEIEIEGIRLKYYFNQAQAKLKQMKDLFVDGEYQRVEVIHGEMVKLTQEMQQVNAHYKPVAEQLLASSTRWQTRAQIRKEFHSRKPSIQGIVISEQGKMAILNERMIKQGESFDDFRVVKVESNKVTFRYKGEEIPLVFRRY